MPARPDQAKILLDNLLTAVILMDERLCIQFVNPAAEQLPEALSKLRELASRLGVQRVGEADGVREQYHAIAVARRVQHPCVAVLTRAGLAGGGRKRRPPASG